MIENEKSGFVLPRKYVYITEHRRYPGAAQKTSPYHYYPPEIAISTGTTVAWFNNDFGQPHTVTFGRPSGPDSGAEFNSGIMPASTNSF